MKTAYINGILLDGTRDMTPQKGKVVITEGKKIREILNQDGANLSDCEVVDLKGKTLLPGLINLHAHLPGTGKPSKKPINLPRLCRLITSNAVGNRIGRALVAKNARTALMSGVTTIRSLGGIANHDSLVRDAISKGVIPGPRILTSNCAISVPGGHMAGTFAYIAHNEKEASELVDKIAKDKPDCIKLMITGGVLDADDAGIPGKLLMDSAIVQAACDRAHELGFPVAAHCEGPAGVKVALQGGVDTIEHGAAPDEEIMDLFAATGARQVITMAPGIPYALALPGVMNLTDAGIQCSIKIMDGMVKLAKACLARGIPVGLGTDSSCSYVTQYGFWRELLYFVQYCGVSNAFALHSATLGNAAIAGIDDITGSIEPGKSADMIAVEGNPLEDLSVLSDVKMVVMEGKRYDSPAVKKYPEVEAVLDDAISAMKERTGNLDNMP